MPKPLPFTEEEMKQVFATNLIAYARSQGFEVEKADRKSCHVKGHGGLYLFPKGYHHFSRGESGNIIDFAREYQGLSFITAVETILGTRAYTNTLPQPPPVPKREELILPPKNNSIQRTRQYLTHERCLDPQIVDGLIEQGKIYEALTKGKGTVYKNCAFVSFDKDGKPRYCSLRGLGGSHFRQDVVNSDKSYGFVMEGNSSRVFAFESPIDAISHATLMKLNGMDFSKDYRISEGCLSDKALTRFLADNPQITEIVFCFDNDVDGKDHKGSIGLPRNLFRGKEEGQRNGMNVRACEDEMKCSLPRRNHGQEYAKKCVEKFKADGYAVYIQTPTRKDFNADLQYIQTSVLAKLREKQAPLPKGAKTKKEEKER